MDIKSWIKAARQHAGFTQTQLGDPLGVGKGNVSAWEKGRHEPSFEQLVQISKITGYTEPLPGLTDVAQSIQVATPPSKPRPWPFPAISEDEVHALPPAQLSELQGALALAIAQLKHGIKVAPTPPVSSRPFGEVLRTHKAGDLVDMDVATDEFPMRIPGLPPAPWDGGKSTFQFERDSRAKISTQIGVMANAGPGEPHAANEPFEEVPELAEVRLAAGDGIENHSEDQTGMIQFRRSFLRSVGAEGGKARVVYAKGDSMEPLIRDGAALLVVPNESLTLQDVASGGVYAINYDGKMLVKTVAKDKLTGRWVARSFNPNYFDVPLENGVPVRVLGQIVWVGSRLRDDEAGQWVRS
ncbi:LexA family transcriptional regulator [Achromobacter sp. UBA4530]|uniref:LexA family transcriptional regulator n=1 Tax=Achromobacter sp. UBA4530 TaxID=1945912 RepID=UPI00257DEF9F|nr:LexA family transcriptional regulator [Achromobacter sp. UBA4530]